MKILINDSMMKHEIKYDDVSGTEFNYFFVCKTQLWYLSHSLIKSDEDENVKIGRLVHEIKYKSERKERPLFRSKFDVVKLNNRYVIYEYKKSAIKDSHIKQLKFYLYSLKKQTDAEVQGILISPGKRIFVSLSSEDFNEIDSTINEIHQIKKSKFPPKPVKIPTCKKCGYRSFCWGDTYEFG